MRTITRFNQNWLFHPEPAADDLPDSAFEAITLPHTNKLFPHHNFDSSEYAFISTYRKRFTLPEPINGRRVYLDFDGAMIAATVSINGHPFPEHRGGYTPFSFDITDHLHEAGENLIAVQLDSTERPDIPPYGNVVDYMTFGGIYRDVFLRYVEPVHIEHVFILTADVLTAKPRVHVEIQVKNQSDTAAEIQLDAALLGLDSPHSIQVPVASTGIETITVPAQQSVVATLYIQLDQPVDLWSLDAPTRYVMKVFAGQPQKKLDLRMIFFGFREAEFRADGGFYLNGERVDLIGLNRHQNYPYIGPAAPPRLQQQDADIIKYELGCNLVRASHYPQSPHFLDRCDEIGLLVFEEIPGWQFIGDADWQALSLRDVRAMIERDRNHPAIILWGVRINESRDNEAFYAQTNALARELDPTRPTGGVRDFQGSQFLEDVFTFNDFSNGVADPLNTPHLICEFNGHMFPTKSWDHEERLIEHALRHARIQDQQLSMAHVAGAIGWCAFDYNTHQQFGSGDRICYHGVMDIFRLPKYAAFFYASQLSPAQRPVLFAATVWAMGDRDASRIDQLVVFSNCDQVEVFVGAQRIGRFEPDRASFPHLPHPPYQIPMGTGNLAWGQHFPDLRVVGYLADQPVAEHCIDAHSLPVALELQADFTELQADGADMTRVIVKIVDRFGNRLPYTQLPISFEIEGPADLIGENPGAVMGGQTAVYVRTQHTIGPVTLRAVAPRLAPAVITIEVAGRS